MQTDIERAVRVVHLASEFGWSWTVDDLVAFSELVGWRLAGVEEEFPALVTDFNVNRRDTMLSVDSGVGVGGRRPLQRISFSVTDVQLAEPVGDQVLDEVFDELTQRIFEVVGRRPNDWWVEPSRGFRWDLEGLVVTVTTSTRSVYVKLVSPEYQRWSDEIEANGDD